MPTLNDLQTNCPITWCPGCGNFGTWAAFKNAAVKMGWDNTNTALIAGIGCHGNGINFIKLTSFEGLHGRSIPVATGIKLANHNLNVFAFSGDGDGLGEGGNHLIHACRRNHDITVILHDNGVYALTTGQTSPASPHDFKSKSTPDGNPDQPFFPLTLAIAAGATFVARGFAGDIPRLSELIIQANTHKGFSFIDVLQPCVTFNQACSYPFYQQNIYYLPQDYDPTDKQAALQKSLEFGEKQIPLGIFYRVEKPSYEEGIPQLKDKPLITNSPVKKDLTDLFAKYR